MNKDEYIELHKKLGFNIYIGDEAWLLSKHYAYSFPAIDNIKLSPSDLNFLKRKRKFIIFQSEEEKITTSEYVFKGDSYDINLFKSKIRNQIRMGLKSCEIREVSLDCLIKEGLSINRSVLHKHNRTVENLVVSHKWEKYIKEFFSHPDIIIYGAFISSKLVAYSIFVKYNERYVIVHPFMNYEYSKFCPINAILYVFINKIISESSFIDITYGLEAFFGNESLDHFKVNMLFKPIERSRVVYFFPPYGMMINSLFLKILRTMSSVGILKNMYNYYYSLYSSKLS